MCTARRVQICVVSAAAAIQLLTFALSHIYFSPGIQHANATLAAMAEAGRRCELYVVHGERSHACRLHGDNAASAGCHITGSGVISNVN